MFPQSTHCPPAITTLADDMGRGRQVLAQIMSGALSGQRLAESSTDCQAVTIRSHSVTRKHRCDMHISLYVHHQQCE
jgi:hypothetical protein